MNTAYIQRLGALRESRMNKFVLILFILMLSGPPKFREREVLAVVDQPIDLAAGVEVGVWLLGGAVVLWLLFRRSRNERKTSIGQVMPSSMRWFLVYAVVAGLSFFHSLFPAFSAYRALQLIVALFLVACLYAERAGRFDLAVALKIVYIFSGLLVVLQAILYVIDPYLVGGDYGTGYRLHGGATSDYGTSALLLGILFLSNALTRSKRSERVLNWFLYLTTWLMILFTKTRITMISALVICLLILLLIKRLSLRTVLLVTAPVLVILFLNIQATVEQVLLREGEGLDTWSGRLPAWHYLWEEFLKSPMFGYGYLAASRMILPYYASTIATAHSALFEALVGVGLFGVIPLLISLIVGWKEALEALRSRHRKNMLGSRTYVYVVQAFAILVFVTLSGVTGTGIAGNASGAVMMFLLLLGGFHQLNLKWGTPLTVAVPSARSKA